MFTSWDEPTGIHMGTSSYSAISHDLFSSAVILEPKHGVIVDLPRIGSAW